MQNIKKRIDGKLIYKTPKNTQLAVRENYLINTEHIEGVISYEVIQKKNYSILEYNTKYLFPMKYILKSKLRKSDYIDIIQQILAIIDRLETNYIDTKMLIYDIEYLYYSKQKKQVYFICVPVAPVIPVKNLRELLLELDQLVDFVKMEERKDLNQYFEIINSGINFSRYDLNEFIKKITSHDEKEYITCRVCGQKIENDVLYCTRCGSLINQFVSKDSLDNYQVVQPERNLVSQQLQGQQMVQPSQQLQGQQMVQPSQQLQGQQMVQPSQQLQGQQQMAQQSQQVSAPVQNIALRMLLTRLATGEMYEIRGSRVVIGKIPGCDIILNNAAISKQHAVITFSGSEFLVYDMNSTNGTYINEQLLTAQMQYPLKHGDCLGIANERFQIEIGV